MGQSPDSATYNVNGEGLPFFQGKADFGRRHPTPRVWCTSPTRVAEHGDILLSVRAPVGDANLASHRCCIGRGLAALRPLSDVDGEFLFYQLLHRRPDLDALGFGATFKAVNRNVLETFELDVPPLTEQRRISTVLASLHAAIDLSARRAAALRQLKAATMAKLFREGLRGEPLKQTEIGEMPESWCVVRLGDHCTIRSGGTPPRDVAEYWDGDIPWVKTGEVNYRPIQNTGEHITRAGLENSSAQIFPKGTLLMAMYGQGVTRGRVAMLDIPSATNQACAALLPGPQLDVCCLYAFCCFAYDRIRDVGHGANQKNLSADLIRQILIPLPPDLIEQRDIGKAVSAIDAAVALAERWHASFAGLFSSTLTLLMTGQVRVPTALGRIDP